MIAVVNLLWCRPGRVGGSEEYLVRQLSGLAVAAPELSVRALVPPGFVAARPDLVAGEVRTGPRWSAWRPGRIVAESTWLARHAAGADVVHHGGGTVPALPALPLHHWGRTKPPPVVLTIHDLQYLRYPEYFSMGRLRYLVAAMPRATRRAAVIAVPSTFVKTTVVDAFGADAARVVVVPHGVDAPPADDLARPGEQELRRRYGLDDRRVVVFPAITHPHKGHRFLVEVASRWPDDVVVVLLGGEGSAEATVRAAIEATGQPHRFVRTGRVPAADRDGLIALAIALAFPSEYEGFGAPVLEAMALGTPVICSDRAAVPEVAGDAAVVRPLSVDAWADALDAVADDRDGLIARGRERAARFTVAVSGAALAAAYRQAVS